MQAWNQVKVKATGSFEGKAGLVVRVDGEVVTVKLDDVPEPQNFVANELQLLD